MNIIRLLWNKTPNSIIIHQQDWQHAHNNKKTGAYHLCNNLTWHTDIQYDVLSSLYNHDMNKQQQSKCSLYGLSVILVLPNRFFKGRVVYWSAPMLWIYAYSIDDVGSNPTGCVTYENSVLF
jgi:hypothetical protein